MKFHKGSYYLSLQTEKKKIHICNLRRAYFFPTQAHKLQFTPEPSHARPLYRRTYGCNYLHFVLTACSHLKKLQLLLPLGHLWICLPLPRTSAGWKQLPAQQEDLGMVRTWHQRNTSLHTVRTYPGQSALYRARDEVLTPSSSLAPMSAEQSVLPYRLLLQPLSVRAAAFVSIS